MFKFLRYGVFKHIVYGTVVSLALATGSASAQPFVFTAIPDEDETRLQERFNIVADYLSEELDVDVRYVPVKSYAAAVSAFRNNQVQLAWFGAVSGVQARELVPGSRALAQGEEDAEFRTYFIANRETGLERGDTLPEDLRGMTFTFGSKGSTSGRLIPEYHIREQFGEAPDDVFSRVGYSGNHSRTMALVESGAYQVGAVNFAAWEKDVESGAVDSDRVRVIWETPPFTNYQWTIRGDVDQRYGDGFMERVQQALLDMDDPDLLASFPRRGFIPVDNEDYDIIRDMGRELDLID